MSESSLQRPLCFYRFCSWRWGMGLQVKSADCGKKQTPHFMPHLLHTRPLSQPESLCYCAYRRCLQIPWDQTDKTMLPNQELSLGPNEGKQTWTLLSIFNSNILEEHCKIHCLWDRLMQNEWWMTSLLSTSIWTLIAFYHRRYSSSLHPTEVAVLELLNFLVIKDVYIIMY